MHVETPLISTIIGGLVLAFIFGTIAQRLRLPPLVGYLVAGVVAGPLPRASWPTKALPRSWRNWA